MKLLTTGILTTALLLTGNAFAKDAELTAADLVKQQLQQVEFNVGQQLSQDIKFAVNTVKMPIVEEEDTLIAKNADKTENNKGE